MSKEEETLRFVAFCIEQYKHRHGGDGESVYNLFASSGVLRFLTDFFDVEHCLDADQILDDIEKIVPYRKGVDSFEIYRERGGRMPGEVTQQNLHLFLPGKVAGVAMLIAKDTGRSALDALRDFYASRTCKFLEREETKYWHYSPSQLYLDMQENSCN